MNKVAQRSIALLVSFMSNLAAYAAAKDQSHARATEKKNG
jgi:hypothetical protein